MREGPRFLAAVAVFAVSVATAYLYGARVGSVAAVELLHRRSQRATIPALDDD